MSDLFQEISEELQYERLVRFWKRNHQLIIGCALAVLISVAGYSIWQHYHQKAGSAATARLIKAMDDDNPALLDDVVNEAPAAQKILAQFELARAALEDSQNDQALAHYEKAAAVSGAPPFFRQLAQLNAAKIYLDKGDVDKADQILSVLIKKATALRPAAMETKALLETKRGNMQAASDVYEKLLGDANTPPAIRERAAAFAVSPPADKKQP